MAHHSLPQHAKADTYVIGVIVFYGVNVAQNASMASMSLPSSLEELALFDSTSRGWECILVSESWWTNFITQVTSSRMTRGTPLQRQQNLRIRGHESRRVHQVG